jgi:hypothetical protein
MTADECSSVPIPTIANAGAQPRKTTCKAAKRPLRLGLRGNPMLEQAKLLIRAATESDLQSILKLYAQSDFDAGEVLPLATAKRLFECFADYPDYTLYVAEHGDEIVGTFALLVMHNLGHLGAPSAIVEDVVVAPSSMMRM